MIVFERHPCINGAFVKVVEFLQLFNDMFLDGLGQPDVVRRKYQFHASNMQSVGNIIQFFLEFKVVGYFEVERLDKWKINTWSHGANTPLVKLAKLNQTAQVESNRWT